MAKQLCNCQVTLMLPTRRETVARETQVLYYAYNLAGISSHGLLSIENLLQGTSEQSCVLSRAVRFHYKMNFHCTSDPLISSSAYNDRVQLDLNDYVYRCLVIVNGGRGRGHEYTVERKEGRYYHYDKRTPTSSDYSRTHQPIGYQIGFSPKW